MEKHDCRSGFAILSLVCSKLNWLLGLRLSAIFTQQLDYLKRLTEACIKMLIFPTAFMAVWFRSGWKCAAQGTPTWCPRAPSRPQKPCKSPAGLFWK